MNKNRIIKPPIKPNPKFGDESKSINQHGELDDKYLPDNHDSFIDSISDIIGGLSNTDYKNYLKTLNKR